MYAARPGLKAQPIRQPRLWLPLENEKPTEPGGFEERLRFSYATPTRQRSKIASCSTGFPGRSTLLDELVYPVSTEEVCLQAHDRRIEEQEIVERQVDGDVDPPRICEPVVDPFVISIGTKPAALSVTEFFSGGHVVEHDDSGIGVPGPLRNDPIGCVARSWDRCTIGNRWWSDRRAVDENEPPILDIDTEHDSPIASSCDDVEREIVEQFVRQDDVDDVDNRVAELGE